MRNVVLALILVSSVRGQVQSLTPTAELSLMVGQEKHPDKNTVSYFHVSSNGLALVTVSYNDARFTSADLDGRILRTRSDLTAADGRPHGAIFRPDGGFWLVSSAPYRLSNEFIVPTDAGNIGHLVTPPGVRTTASGVTYTDLDEYDAAGQASRHVRLLITSGRPIAAGPNGQLVLLDNGFARPLPMKSSVVHFGHVLAQDFREQTQVRLEPAVGGLPQLTSDGNLVLIDRRSGNLLVIDPKAQHGTIARLTPPRRIRAATTDSDSIYLFSDDLVLKLDLSGRTVATYRLHYGRGFEPLTIGVTGNLLYVFGRARRVERFDLN